MSAKHTPGPEYKAAILIESAWRKYVELYGVTVHGTHNQLMAMLCLAGGKEIVCAVNAHDDLMAALRVAKSVLSGCCSCGASVSAIKDIDSAIAKAEGETK